MNELPQGWTSAAIADLISPDGLFSDGDWVESKDQDVNGSIRLIQLADIGDGVFIDKSNRYLNEDKFIALRCTEIFENDVLVARMPNPLGRACIFPPLSQKCITVVDVAILRPGKFAVNPRWLMHFINSPATREIIEMNSSGSTRRRISRGNLSQIILPVPPLNEQKRIADKLDTLLARVDDCRERLDRVPQILKRFRQAVLAAATSGALTEEWRENEGILLGHWKQVTLGELVLESANGLSKRKGNSGQNTVVLRLADFKNAERFVGNERFIMLDAKEQKKYLLAEEDILVVRVNGSRDIAGRFISYKNSSGSPEAYCDHFIRLRFNKEIINSKFILYVANSGSGRNYLESQLITSAGQNTINQTSLFSLAFQLPSFNEQHEIVRRVEILFAFADRLEARYTAGRDQVDQLTPSLLDKAFRGELVPQDSNDEPAAKLLERIQTARQEPTPTVRREKRRQAQKVEVKVIDPSEIQANYLSNILKNQGRQTAKALWKASQLKIEDFYEQLRTEEASGLLREIKVDADSYLEAA